MSPIEAGLLIEAHNNEYKEEWEKIRWQSYIIAASNGAKVKKPSDLIKFNWEKEIKNDDKRTPEQIEASKKKLMKAMAAHQTKQKK